MTRKDFLRSREKKFDRKSIPQEHFVRDFELFTSYTATRLLAEILDRAGQAAAVAVAFAAVVAAFVVVVVAFYCLVQVKPGLILLLHCD
jgi:hypothetical protein